MYSRAHLLIELEHEKLVAHPLWGIEARPVSDDSIFEWRAKIKGLNNTLWEDGIFTVFIKFDEHYNVRPPTVFFQTVPFHPNVDVNSGRPCVDFLDDYDMWNEDYSLSMILLSLQALLSNPVCENALNVDAARMLMNTPDLYHQMIKECVANSRVVEAQGANVHILPHEAAVRVYKSSPADKPATAPPRTRSVQTKKLSFEEYHRTWLGIATSKAKPRADNLNSIKDKSWQQSGHLGMFRVEAEQVTEEQLQAHNMLVYGPVKSRWESEKDSKLAKLKRMKQIYLPYQQTSVAEICDGNTRKTFSDVRLQSKTDISEEEVNDLVLWSYNLDSNFLDQS
ncbi:hypothetical protein BsWGS_02326 [Bradybaena similaris]